MRRFSIVLIVVATLAGAGVVRAQEQRGSIEGRVTDTSGGVLPGAKVEARSPSLVGVASATTDEQGVYRFPSLAPGIYRVIVALDGFRPSEVQDVYLALGQTLRIDMVLVVADVAESVEIRGQPPLVDVSQNVAGTTVPRELVERVPDAEDLSGNRDAMGLVVSAPGISQERRNFGLQVDGASGGDNRFLVDGVDTTSLLWGTSGRTLVPDFAQEIQAKASGVSAEHRGSIGGVVSAISKSGGNAWHGSAGFYLTSDTLQGDARPGLRLNPSNQTIAEYVTSPPDDVVSPEAVFDVGGPVRRDRVWFYLGYDHPWTRRRRTVTFRDSGERATFESRPENQTYQYNVTAQLSGTLRLRASGANQRSTAGIALPFVEPDGTSGSNSALFPSQTVAHGFWDTYAAVLDWTPDSRTYVNLTTTAFRWGGYETGDFSDEVQHLFVGSNFQFPDIPPDLQQINGYMDAPWSDRWVRDDTSRFGVNADVTRYLTWRGAHAVKAGVQFERVANALNYGMQAPSVQLFWDASLATADGRRVRGAYGYYTVGRFVTEGDVRAHDVGVFVQDTWTLDNRVTLNLGVRTEREEVPSYRPENPGLHFDFSNKIAPRAGFAYDVRGDGRWKVYGSWGVFHDLTKLMIGRVMFGADHWVETSYTLDSYDWPVIRCGAFLAPDPDCPGMFIEQIDYRPTSNDPVHSLVDPALRPSRSQEAVVGLDHALSSTMSVGARYVHKWVDRAMEAVGSHAAGGVEFWVTNPGFGQGEYPFGPDFPAQPRAERVYDGLELRLRRRLANRWSLDTSYLWSRLWGNWSGIATSDEAARLLQPNSGTIFDLLYYSYDARGQTTLGRLGTDRPHQFKLQATYDLPWGTMIGGNFLLESGIPSSTLMTQKGMNFYPYGRGDRGRTPLYSQLDLRVQQRFALGRGAQLLLGVNAANLFDQAIVTRYFTFPYRDKLNVADATFFAGFDPVAVATARRFRPDPRFGQAFDFQRPRVIRFQAKVMF